MSFRRSSILWADIFLGGGGGGHLKNREQREMRGSQAVYCQGVVTTTYMYIRL